MPYQYWWEIEKHVICVRYSGELDVPELTQSIKEMTVEIVDSGQPFVNIIIDVSEVTRAVPVPEAARMVRQLTPVKETGWLILVGVTNPIIKFGGAMASQIMNQRMRTVNTKDEALAFLHEADPSINWDHTNKD